MEIIATLQNGQPQVAEVTLEEYNTLQLAPGRTRFVPNESFGELKTLRVYFNKKGEVHSYKPRYKSADIPDLVDVFKDVEKKIENENLDRDTAAAHLKKNGYFG